MRLPCLSIRQPWVEEIFNGSKPVENRGWIWMQHRDWTVEGPVLLGIHASSSRGRWNELTGKERRQYLSGPPANQPPFGCLVGVAKLVHICRPRDLPERLRNHKCVNKDKANWCWVLDNPRRFPKPIPATGQACLFYVAVPDTLIGATGFQALSKDQLGT